MEETASGQTPRSYLKTAKCQRFRIPRIQFTFNNSVSAAISLARNEIHLDHLPSFPITIFELGHTIGSQSLESDQLACCDLANDRQLRAYKLVREHHMITTSCTSRSNVTLVDTFLKRPSYKIGDWVWMYNAEATIRQSASKRMRAPLLSSESSLNWTDPFKHLNRQVDPSTSAFDGRLKGDKFVYLDISSVLPNLKPNLVFQVCDASLVSTLTIPRD